MDFKQFRLKKQLKLKFKLRPKANKNTKNLEAYNKKHHYMFGSFQKCS